MVCHPSFILIAMFFLSVSFAHSAGETEAYHCPLRFGDLGRATGILKLPGRSNPQIRIWRLEAAGEKNEAERLRQKIKSSMQTGPLEAVKVAKADSRNKPLLVELHAGARGIWKRKNRGTKKELIAAKFDEMTGAEIVPITVERELNGQPGYLQLFVRGTDNKQRIFSPQTLKLFDFLIVHPDRTAENYLIHRGRTIAIDNELTFSANAHPREFPDFPDFISKQLQKLEQAGGSAEARAAVANEIATTLISQSFINRLRTFTVEEWQKGLAGLSNAEFKSFLKRKNQAVAAIDRAEKILGASIFPTARFSGLSRDRWFRDRDRMERFMAFNRNAPDAFRDRVERAMELTDEEVLIGPQRD